MVEIMNAIINFFKNVGSYIGVDLISVIAFGATLFTILIAVVVSSFSVEVRTNKKVKQINNYLVNNPFITDENIVEFNRIMKNGIPRAMRYQWQRYMVNRNDRPSIYLSEENCITKPFRTSAFVQVMKQLKYFVSILAVASFMFILGAIYERADNLPSTLLRASIVPLLIISVTVLFMMLMTARRNSVLGDLFYNFDGMQHSLDRAVTTFPAFVDYEILFTRKEISAGIPALQEYLQQRAEYEQEQLERARLSQVEHEKYDFSKLGVKGNMIMESAMKECEFYLGNRKILLTDIASLQSQKDLLTKNYDEKNRTNQRKLRDFKDDLDRNREKLNSTTNKIVANDIIKQQTDLAKKQQLVEKEIEDDSNHFMQDVQKLDEQIQHKKDEIEDNRKEVERKLSSDFKDYSNKIYEELKNLADNQNKTEIEQLKEDKQNLEHELEDREQLIAQKNAMFGDSSSPDEVAKQLQQKDYDLSIKNQEVIGANKETESRKAEINQLQQTIENLRKEKYHEVYRYFDSNGTEFFYDRQNNPYYLDDEGKTVYYSDLDKINKLKNTKLIGEETVPKQDNNNGIIKENISEVSEVEVLNSEPEVKEGWFARKKREKKERDEQQTQKLQTEQMAHLSENQITDESNKEETLNKQPTSNSNLSKEETEKLNEILKGEEEIAKPEDKAKEEITDEPKYVKLEEKPVEHIKEVEVKEIKQEIKQEEKPAVKEEVKSEEMKKESNPFDFGDMFAGLEENPVAKSKESKAEKPVEVVKKPEEKMDNIENKKPEKAEEDKKTSTTAKKKAPIKKKELIVNSVDNDASLKTRQEKAKDSDDKKPAKKAKKGPAFAIKKAPKVEGGNSGFDLSAFDALSGDGKGKK